MVKPVTFHSDHLNQEQIKAVNHIDGPLLILAGAGTGKTKVLTSRIAHLIANKYALAGEIMAVTFTNKAANEMKERVGALLGESIAGMYIGTFHSLSTRILRNHCHLLGLNSNFTIIDQDDQIRLIKRIVKELNYDQEKLNYKFIVNKISAWKDRFITSEQVKNINELGELVNISKEVYQLYQNELQRSNSCDFGDLILHVIRLLSEHKQIQDYYNHRFKYILVDEYQDTNTAQYLWLRLLAAGKHNICCVGDDDQSIYGFRGAEIENILRFEHDFSGAKVIKLQENYRSTQHILNIASQLIDNNQKRHKKKLFTAKSTGNKVKIISNWDDRAEAHTVADEINKLLSNKHNAGEIAILVRAFFQTRNFEEILLNKGIPYKIIGGLKFYDRREIKDIICYLRIIHATTDNLALERIINVPKRGIGPATLHKINDISREKNISLYDALCESLNNNIIKGKAHTELKKLISLIKEAKILVAQITLHELAKYIVLNSGYKEMLKIDKEINYETKLENLQE